MGIGAHSIAWESADSGEEVTPPFVVAPDGEIVRFLTGEQEQHISADVAFGVWSYWRSTGDDRFLIDAGAEILIETARFWASRVEHEEDGRYHIRGVIGPDEYHETVDDNAYTNGLAQWNLEVAARDCEFYCGALAWAVAGAFAPARYRSRRSRAGGSMSLAISILGSTSRPACSNSSAAISALEEIDLASFVPRTAPMDVLLGRERIARSKVIKQPDVLMLVYLLWDRMPPEVRKANFEYYEPRCGHGSSLSPAIHALVAARLGDTALAERYFRQAAEIDWRTTWGTRPAAFTPGPSAAYGRPRCSALLACASAEEGLSIARTFRLAGAACRCAISGGASGTNSRFRKVKEAAGTAEDDA